MAPGRDIAHERDELPQHLGRGTLARRYRIEGAPLLLDDGNEREHARVVWKGESTVHIEDAFARSDRTAGQIWRDFAPEDIETTTRVLNELLERARAVLAPAR